MTNKALDQEIAVNSATANKECSSPCSVGIQEEIMDPINFFQLSDLPEWPETYEHIEAMHKIWIASPEDDADAFSFSETANGRSYYFYGRKVFEFFPAKTKRSSPRFRLPTTIETKEGSVVEKYETFEVAVHEYAHAACGGCYIHSSPFQIKERYENRARKWAYHRYLPPSRLMDAFREGITTPWDIADRFDVTPKFVAEAVAYYRLTGEIK